MAGVPLRVQEREGAVLVLHAEANALPCWHGRVSTPNDNHRSIDSADNQGYDGRRIYPKSGQTQMASTIKA